MPTLGQNGGGGGGHRFTSTVVDENAWQNQTLFTQWSPGLHLPWAKMLASELPVGDHTLELRVSQQADERSKGHAIRIIHFLINDPSVAAGAPAFK